MDSSRVPVGLRERLGTEATDGLLDLLEAVQTEWRVDVIAAVADRFERRIVEETSKLREETSKLRIEMIQGFSAIRQEIAALRQEIADGRFELLKWAFVFWVGQFFATAGLIAVLIRFLRPGG